MIKLNIDIPQDFLKEEIRYNYRVSQKTKELWAVMLDLLCELDRVCKKYNLTYFANGGTMIGAIRHKGFIPWDDDLDVMMLRKDYDKLMEVGPSEFKHPYFLQTKYTEPSSPSFFAKLRNSTTTALDEGEKHSIMDYNKGIFIDIFPYDAVPADKEQEAIFRNEINNKRQKVIKAGRSIGVFSETDNLIDRCIKSTISKLLSYRRKKHTSYFLDVFRDFENDCSRYKNTKTGYFANLEYSVFGSRFHEEDLSDTINMDFEFIKIPVAIGYDHLLTEVFGDYMKPVIYESHHAFIDTSKSYKDYIR